MGFDKIFYKPQKTCLNLGISCLIAGEACFQNASSNEPFRISCTVSCVSRLIDLRRFRHPNIVRYIDAQCNRHRHIYLVTEHYASDFSHINPPVSTFSDFRWLLIRFQECLHALTYLECNGIVHGCLNPSAILIDNFGHVKIAGYGTFYASRWGIDLDFPIVDLRYSSPEALLLSKSLMEREFGEIVRPPCHLDTRSDVWSLAIIFIELLHFPLQNFYPRTLLEALLQSLNSRQSFFPHITWCIQQIIPRLNKWTNKFDSLCELCLILDARYRPPLSKIVEIYSESFIDFQLSDLNVSDEKIEDFNEENDGTPDDFKKALRFLQLRGDPAESYYYWQLAGGGVDLASTFLKGINGCDCLRPPILRLPIYLTSLSSEQASRSGPLEIWSSANQPIPLKFCPTVVLLPAERLLKRLALMSTESLYPLLFPHSYSCVAGGERKKIGIVDSLALARLEECWQQSPGPSLSSHLPKHELSVVDSCKAIVSQPVLVKQADVEYQVMRVCLFRRLLAGMPSTATRILLEARFDIPPFLRGEVWAALLGVQSGFQDDASQRKIEAALFIATQWKSSNSLTHCVGLSDHVMGQIGVDLPRCHAYDLLIGSPIGQERLRSVLVAALLSDDNRFEYTQGMDSLAAVFTRLFFSSPEMATHCLSNLLISPHLAGFFSRRRFTAGLQVYFVFLLRLLSFHVPAVAAHFAHLGVPLTGLTAGWIYTLFAHSMPLDRTEILWDSVLAAPHSIPMFVYVAIFHQLNQQCRLLLLNQESICTLLSNFPDFNLDQCLEDALNFAAATPISLTSHSTYRNSPSGWVDSLSRSLRLFNQTHTKTPLSAPIELASSHYCVNCLSTWPVHMDAMAPNKKRDGGANSIGADGRQPSPAITFKRNEVDYRSINSSLVSLIDPIDALQQLSRPDCVLVDTRSKEEYCGGCLMQSVNIFPVKMEASITYLVGCPLWRNATIARNSLNPRGCSPAQSPGLVMLLERSSISDSVGDGVETINKDDSASSLACCLIRNAIDRVCVVRGGARALFDLPQITDYFVPPPV